MSLLAFPLALGCGLATKVPEVPEAEQVQVEALLKSLTRDGFEQREDVVRRLGAQGVATATELLAIARDDGSPLQLRAKYMLRRTFWEFAPKLLKEMESADTVRRNRAEKTFLDLVNLYPLDDRQYESLHKLALVYERLGRYDKALETYEGWKPTMTMCGTCDAGILAGKSAAIRRCLLKLKQEDKAEALFWSESNAVFDPQFMLTLVDLYEARGQLDQLAAKIKDAGQAQSEGRVVLEAIYIRNDFKAERYGRLTAQLEHHLSLNYFDLDTELRRDWHPKAVADGFGKMGDKAVPLLAEHLRTHRLDGWTLYALQRTRSELAVKVVIEAAQGHDLESKPVLDALKPFRKQATSLLIPLLANKDLQKFQLGDSSVKVLGRLGTEEAIEPLIEQVGERQNALWALWRLTGETLELETLPRDQWKEEGRARWRAWWAKNRNFKVKTEEWWDSADAAATLVKAVAVAKRPEMEHDNSMFGPVLQGLTKLEHPALAQFLEVRGRRGQAARAWLRFDPTTCIPLLIEDGERNARPHWYQDRWW